MNILYAVCLAMYLGVLTYKSSKEGKYCKSQPNSLNTDVTVALETCTLYNLALIKLQVFGGKCNTCFWHTLMKTCFMAWFC